MYAELLVQNGDTIYQPAVEEGISWELERKGAPGKLTFKVLHDRALDITEGNPVRLTIDGERVFYGFIFQKKRDQSRLVTITAYDQLRYLKNKDTYVYANKTASQLVQMLADDFQLQCGTLEDTQFVIESRVEDNQTLFDIIQNALDLTLQYTTQMFVLYDDFGRITLKNIGSMKVPVLIDADTGQSFEYTSSIDNDTYDQIKLAYENESTGKRDIYIARNSSHINEWGVLQYFETVDDPSNAAAKADLLLKLYDQKTRTLTVNNAFGDVRVRAGSLIPVSFTFDDVTINHYMLVEKVKHTFSESLHTMNLTLRGGEFIA